VVNFERAANEIFVFTTQYDRHISSFLSLFSGAKIYLSCSVKAASGQQGEIQNYHVFKPFKTSLIPGLWVFAKDKNNKSTLAYNVGDITIKQDALDVKLI